MNNTDFTIAHGSSNVFSDLGFPQGESDDLKARADLMLVARERIQGMSIAQAAETLDMEPSFVEDLLAGEIDRFSVEQLDAVLRGNRSHKAPKHG